MTTKAKTPPALPRCPLCGREMLIDSSFGRFFWPFCPAVHNDSGHMVQGPSRRTKRGAINAFNRMVEKQHEAIIRDRIAELESRVETFRRHCEEARNELCQIEWVLTKHEDAARVDLGSIDGPAPELVTVAASVVDARNTALRSLRKAARQREVGR